MARVRLLTLLAVTVTVGHAETWRLPLTLATAPGCRADARSAELLEQVPTAGPDGLIVIDGAQPSRWSQDADAAARDEQGWLASDYLRYDFLVPAAGSYTLHALVSAPPGRSRFVEFLDGARIGAHLDEENPDGPAPSHWVERLPIKLTAGLHQLAVASFGYSMMRVEKLVLAPGAVTLEGAGPRPTLAPLEQAEVVTLPIAVPGLTAVSGLEGVPEGVASERIGAPPEPLRFRFTLDRDHPHLGPLTLVAEVPDGRLASLVSGDAELIVDRASGGLFLLRQRADDRLLAGGLAATPLVAIEFKKPGEAVWRRVDPAGAATMIPKEQYSQGVWDTVPRETSDDATAPEAVEIAADGATISHVFDAPGYGRARLTQRLEPTGDGAFRATATVETLAGPADVVAVTFPRLEEVRVGADGLDDVQLRMQSFGHRAVQPGRQPIRNAAYLGSVVMNWTQVYDPTASVYLGVHDPRGLVTVHRSQPTGAAGESVGLSTQRLDEIPAGESAAWQTMIAVGGGGWHDGARRYGDWFDATHGTSDYPAWLRESMGWLDLQAENYGPNFRFEQLGDWLTYARAIGFDWVQVWGQFAYDGGPCCSAWYGPSPLYGGSEGWRAAATEIKQRGGQLGGYFIYDRVDRLPVWLDTFLGQFRKADYGAVPWDTAEFQHELRSIEDPAGTVPPPAPSAEELAKYRGLVDEQRAKYAAGERAAPVQWWMSTYIPDPRWHDYLASWIGDRYVGEWGSNTAYIDVLGTGGADVSYDPRRGHNGDGQWPMGRLEIARAVVARGRAHDPEFGLTQEGLGDLPSLSAAPMCSGVYRGERNVVRYTFPDRVLIHGMANAGSGRSALDRFLITFREAMRYDIVGRPSSLEVSLVNLQRPFVPALYQAIFRDTEGLATSDPRLEARQLDATTTELRARLLTITNPTELDGTVTLAESEFGRPAAVFVVPLDGPVQRLALAWADGAASFPVPTQLAAMAVVPAGDGPLFPFVRLDRAGTAIEVNLLNLGAADRAGTCTLANRGYVEPFEDLPADEALPLTMTASGYRVAAHGLQKLVYVVRDLAAQRWTVQLGLELTGEATGRATALLTPLIPDGSFELLGATPGDAPDGAQTLELGPTAEGYLHRTVELWLLPNRRYSLELQAKRTGFEAAVAGTLLRLHKDRTGTYDDHRWGLDRAKPNEWQQLGGEFTTPADMSRALLYLYNVRSPDTAWFDDLRITDLGPLDR